jgi:hypothetical protein
MVTERARPIAGTCLFTGADPTVFEACPIHMPAAVTMDAPISEVFPFRTEKAVFCFIERKSSDGIDALVVLTPIVLDRDMGINAAGDESMEE